MIIEIMQPAAMNKCFEYSASWDEIILIRKWGLVVDYSCGKFCDSNFIERTDIQADRQTHRRGWSLYSHNFRRREQYNVFNITSYGLLV